MSKKFSVVINSKVKKFIKTIIVDSDKSISHRALVIARQCIGSSSLKGILQSEDGNNTILCLKKLGVKIKKKIKNILFMETVWDLLENLSKALFM